MVLCGCYISITVKHFFHTYGCCIHLTFVSFTNPTLSRTKEGSILTSKMYVCLDKSIVGSFSLLPTITFKSYCAMMKNCIYEFKVS
jgi:hypothetical protein